MRFDSYIFVLFFASVIVVYWLLRGHRRQNVLILAASYLFYGWWDYRFLSLLIVSTFVDFFVSQRIEATDEDRARRRLLYVSLAVNLGILGFFKYWNFFTDSFIDGLDALGLDADVPTTRILLPVGISFYTFQTLSYTIDVYRRRLPATRSLLDFACYVTFFPQLVAGPIERAPRLLPQFSVDRTIDVERIRSGVTLIVYGLVKKIAIADNVGPYADHVFGLRDSELSGPLVVAGLVAFAVQIYADFSGYSDIARGTARLIGFELCVNFERPYLAHSPSDFWRRWHISLSQWLRDYLYIPLGGNRGGSLMTYRNLMITMALGGLWHGAAWNFVVWGIWHGTIQSVYRALDLDRRIERTAATRIVGVATMLPLTLYGWLTFRASSLSQIVDMTEALLRGWSVWGLAVPMLMTVGWYSMPIAIHHALAGRLGGEKWQPRPVVSWQLTIATVIMFGFVHARASETAFIYFQF